MFDFEELTFMQCFWIVFAIMMLVFGLCNWLNMNENPFPQSAKNQPLAELRQLSRPSAPRAA